MEKNKKNEKLVELRRQKILSKYLETEERIKKQKDENNKELFKKYLENAMKREDNMDNLKRFERQKEFEREARIDQMLKRDKRLQELQRQKTQINIKKKQLNRQMSERKKSLIGKANNILLSGEYDNIDTIFKKVFNKDEYEIVQKNKSKEKDINGNEKENNTKGNGFFTTQI